MKYFLPIACLLALSPVSAQITITNADMPDAGDSVRVSYALTLGPVDHTLTDTNYIWDFSFLTPSAQERIEFIAPTAFPFNFLSDMGVVNQSPDSIPGAGELPTNFSDYYKGSSSGFRQVGSSFDYAPIGSFSIPIIYSSPDYIYRFPMGYGNVDSCDASYGFNIPGIGYIGQDRHRVNTIDGWGTLITPLDTYQVVRIRSVVNATDTISLDTAQQTGYAIQRPTGIQYKWLAPGMKLPVLEIDCQVIMNTEIVTGIIYQDTLRDSLWQVNVPNTNTSAPGIVVYPNPADDVVNIQHSNLEGEILTITIVDIQGRTTPVEVIQNVDLAGNLQINISDLPAGTYLLNISTTNGTVVSRIAIY